MDTGDIVSYRRIPVTPFERGLNKQFLRIGDPGTRAFASAGLNVWAWVFIATV